MSEHCSINRHVISGSILKLLQLIDKCCGPHSTIYGYNTDTIYMMNPRIDYPVKDKSAKFTSDMIGKVYKKPDESFT